MRTGLVAGRCVSIGRYIDNSNVFMYAFLQELFGKGGSTKKKVTEEEMKRIMTNIYGKLDQAERNEVEKLFAPHLHEAGLEAGISKEEYEQTIAWLKANKNKHVLEDSDIAYIEKYFVEHLQD